MKTGRPAALLLAAMFPFALPALAADEGGSCSAYMMDVSAELELFAQPAAGVQAGGTPEAAPAVQIATLYAVRLVSQQQVRYPATLARRPIQPKLQGGMLRLQFTEPGRYRVSTDVNVWIDAVYQGQPLEAVDFRSDRDCSGGPTKIVTFNVPAGAELVLQFLDVERDALRLAVTPVPQPVW